MLRGYLLVMLAAFLWGTIGPASKVAFAHGMEPAEVAMWRTVLAWFFFFGQALVIKRLSVPGKDMPLLVGFAVMAVAGLHGFYMFAVQEGGVALASVLLYTAPAWVAVLSRIVFREAMGWAKLTAVAMTIMGVIGVSYVPGMFSSGSRFSTAAVLFGLASGISYSLYYIFGKTRLGQNPTPTLFIYSLPLAALALLPFCEFSTTADWKAYAACMSLAFFSTYGANSVYYAGLRHLEATRAAVVATLEPVVASMFGFLIYGERFGLWGYFGSVLILGAVLIIIIESTRRPRGMAASTVPEGES